MANPNIGAGGEAKFLVMEPEDRARAVRALGALQDEATIAESNLAAHLVLDPTPNCGCGEHRKGVISFCAKGLALYDAATKSRGRADYARQALVAMKVPNLPGSLFQVTE